MRIQAGLIDQHVRTEKILLVDLFHVCLRVKKSGRITGLR